MVVHASENFYVAPGATDMAGPESLLLNETDRLWVSVYDGFSRMAVPLFMIVPAIHLYSVPQPLVCEVWGQCFWNEYHMLWYFSGYLGYLVLAHYIRVHLTWDRSRRLVIGSLLMIVGAALTIYSFYIQAIPGEIHTTPAIEIGWAFCTINCVLFTVGTFLLFTCIDRPKAPRLITEISKLSYEMYLMHIFWLGLWVTMFKNGLELPTVAAIPCIAVCTFISCLVTAKIISFIPGSKWIIG